MALSTPSSSTPPSLLQLLQPASRSESVQQQDLQQAFLFPIQGRIMSLVADAVAAPTMSTTTAATAAYGSFTSTGFPALANATLAAGDDKCTYLGCGLIILAGIFFAVLTTAGNLMVMVSFKIDKQLQTISNYFLFSLAVADLMIGCISIPLMTYYIVNGRWDIGYVACQFWLCIDYLMSNASVLNLLLISFDRYFSVTLPLTYRPRRTTRKALIMISCTYIISLLLWPPWIILWPYIDIDQERKKDTCAVAFLDSNVYVTVGTAVAAFYLPVTIMIGLYGRVYSVTKKRQREFGRLQANQNRSVREKNLTSAPSSNSISKQQSSLSQTKRDRWNSSEQRNSIGRGGRRWAWLRMCAARSMNSSEDSSEAPAGNGGAGGDNVSISSSRGRGGGRGGGSRPVSPPQTIEDTISIVTDAVDSGNCTARNGSRRSNRAPLVRANATAAAGAVGSPAGPECYTVVIELNEQGERPTIRLAEDWNGNCNNARTRSKSEAIGPADEIRKLTSMSEAPPPPSSLGMSSFAAGIGGLLRNGKARLINNNGSSGNERKSEKERKKNERKQESKAAKTLSAILFAFILTWTPYNVIVCMAALNIATVPNFIYNIAYSLCYINSTINPLCYALCNARFRHTYKRILRCQFKAERPTMANAYYRRT